MKQLNHRQRVDQKLSDKVAGHAHACQNWQMPACPVSFQNALAFDRSIPNQPPPVIDVFNQGIPPPMMGNGNFAFDFGHDMLPGASFLIPFSWTCSGERREPSE